MPTYHRSVPPCPDHLVHTKRQPLFIDWKPEQGVDALEDQLKSSIQGFIDRYTAYFQTHSQPNDTMRDPAPRVILIPGIGMINTGADAQNADVSRQLYHRAVAVAGGSQTLSQFRELECARGV